MKHYKEKNKIKISIVIGLALLFFIGLELSFLMTPRVNNNASRTIYDPLDSKTLKTYASAVMKTCKTFPRRSTCYDKEIPKLMNTISMEDTFKVTSLVQDQDSTYRYCHVLGHNLSQKEIQKDPSKWKEVLTRCPSGTCSNGCIHGGLQEKFRKESLSEQEIQKLKPDFASVCEEKPNWKPTPLEKASCYHALGHLAMYVYAADTSKAARLCTELTQRGTTDYSQVCYDGVFMQIFQPLEPEDFALVKGKTPSKESVVQYCAKNSPVQQASCLNESWPMFFDEIKTSEGLTTFCAKVPSPYTTRCYNAMFSVLSAQFNFDPTKIEALCKNLSPEIMDLCYANSASRMIETDYRFIPNSVSLCNAAPTDSAKNACYQELIFYSTFTTRANSKEFYDLCKRLPKGWKDKCLEKKSE